MGKYGEKSTERANSRPPMRSHAQVEGSSSSSSSSSSDDEDVQVGDFGPSAGAGYERVIPARFDQPTETHP